MRIIKSATFNRFDEQKFAVSFRTKRGISPSHDMTLQWSNWSGSVQCAPHVVASPQSEAELIALIKDAAHRTIRVAGTGHSFVPLCATDDLLISLDKLQGVIVCDVHTARATIWAGTKIHQLGEPLLACGVTLENQGDIDRQTTAGALSTGTHGTGHTLGSMSTQVSALRIVTTSGEVVECSETREPALFKAAQVSLGTLGVISQVTLRVLPAYRLHERTWVAEFDECMAQLDQLVASNRHFEFFWSPRDDACAMKSLNLTEADRSVVNAAPLGQGRLARYMKPERVDWSYRIFPSERNLCFNEMEFAVPAAQGPDCLREIRTLMQMRHPEVSWPIEYRTLAADDIWLSPAYARATVTISIHQAAELPHEQFFADAEHIFRNHHGRPHWGKMHSYRAHELRDLYPMWDEFQTVRQQLDPTGRLMNVYIRELMQS